MLFLEGNERNDILNHITNSKKTLEGLFHELSQIQRRWFRLHTDFISIKMVRLHHFFGQNMIYILSNCLVENDHCVNEKFKNIWSILLALHMPIRPNPFFFFFTSWLQNPYLTISLQWLKSYLYWKIWINDVKYIWLYFSHFPFCGIIWVQIIYTLV